MPEAKNLFEPIRIGNLKLEDQGIIGGDGFPFCRPGWLGHGSVRVSGVAFIFFLF